jgi:hypothetical protein
MVAPVLPSGQWCTPLLPVPAGTTSEFGGEMSGHQVTVVPVKDNQWIGRCSCRATGKVTESHWVATQWTMTHRREVERIKTHLAGRTPSLTDQRNYYLSKAADDAIPSDQRLLWAQLADELTRRLGDDNQATQTQLF